MIIEITIRKTQICLRRGGAYTSLVVVPMERPQAEALVPQYGFRPDEIVMVVPLDMHYRHYIDDNSLQDVLNRYPWNPNRSQEELLQIIRRHFQPNATRIIH